MEKLKEVFWLIFSTICIGTILGIFFISVPVALIKGEYISTGLGVIGACIGIALYSVYGIVQTLRRK